MMVNGLEELEAHVQAVSKKADDEEFVNDDDDDQAALVYNDLVQALDLLKKCVTLLDYLAEPVLVHEITARERKSMIRLSNNVAKFVEDVEESYEDQ